MGKLKGKFGGLGLYRKARERYGKKYKNEEFWTGSFGEGYYNMYTTKLHYKDWMIKHEEELIKYLKTIKFETVLEFGCGFGRISKIICDNFNVKRYDAFDLSPHQIENAKKHCKDLPINFIVTSFKNFESDQKYDLVIGCECLIHIPPEDVEYCIEKMVSYSKKYFTITGLPYKPHVKTYRATNTWHHDYDKIFKTHNLSISKIPIVENNEITNCVKKNN